MAKVTAEDRAEHPPVSAFRGANRPLRRIVTAWALSVTLHGLLLLALVAAVQQIAPQIPIYAVTSDLALMEELSRQDLRDIRLRSESTGSEVGRMILTYVGRTEPEVDEILERVAAMERGEDPVLEVPV